MKLEIIKSARAFGMVLNPGTIVEVTDAKAHALLDGGVAKRPGAKPAKAQKQSAQKAEDTDGADGK